MTVQKITTDITPLEEIEKINEIIDNLGQGGSVLMTGGNAPKYDDGKSVSSPYTVESDGWIFWGANVAQGPNYLYVNGNEVVWVGAFGQEDTTAVTTPIPVSEGDVVSWDLGDCKFYPRLDYDSLGNRYLGTLLKSLLPIEDSSLHLLDGEKLEYTGIYRNFIDHIANLYGDGTNVPAYFCSESDWQTSVSSYGSCGRFVYDSVNQTVRLPKVSDIIQGTSDVNALGELTEAGAPNITGQVGTSDNASYYPSGAFYQSASSGHGNGSGGSITVSMDASRSSSVYGNSTTVQPQTIKALYYMVVATGSREEVKLNFDAKADKDLVNTGYITNCITDVPQDIKLELNNGTLTLKAGSKIYVPNGNDVFYTVIIPNDIAIQGWSNVSGIILIDNIGSSYAFTDLSQCYSGASSPTIADGVVWYDTTNNIVKRCNDGSTWTSGYSLPIAIATSNNSNPGGISGIASLDKVFNGFGFIGSVLFALPGVTGLLPNGRNEDGTLNNIKYTIDSVRLREFSWDISGSGQYLALYSSGEIIGSSATNRPFYQQEETPPTYTNSYWYKPSENCSYATFNSDAYWIKFPLAIIGKIVGDATGKISSLTTKTTIKLIDENDVHNAEAVVETYSNGNNWYRIWSDGWCEQGGISTGVADIQLLKPFSNVDYGVVVTRRAQSENIPFVRNITVSGFTIGWKVEGQSLDVNFVNCTWEAFGYIS